MMKKPINLLRTAAHVDGLARALSENREKTSCPAAGEAWREIASRPCARAVLRSWREQVDREIGLPWEAIPEERYAGFSRTGDRSRWEALHMDRRLRLGRLALWAAIEPENPVLTGALLTGWRAVLAEVSWANPAHVSHPSGIDPLNVDLKCAETALMLAWLSRIFRGQAPADLLAATRARLRAQVWENYLAAAEGPDAPPPGFRWMRIKNNWNAVCHGGVLASALLLGDDDGFVARLLTAAAGNLSHYLDGFGEDGGCSEGPSYWSYGFGFFAVLNRELEARTGGGFSLFEDDPKILKIARFPLMVAVENQQTLNFADAADRALPPDLPAYLGRRLGDGELTRYSEIEYAAHGLRDARTWNLKPGFLYEVPWLLNCPADTEPGKGGRFEGRSGFLPDLQVWVSRGTDAQARRWVVGAKCGHNAEHHNHNDVGGFVLFLNGAGLLFEIGMPSYHRDFFRPDSRYRFLAARSFGHSVPLVNGEEQAAGENFRGRVLETIFSDATDRFVLDLAGAYPPSARCLSAVRTIEVEKKRFRLRVRDAVETAGAGTLESAVITAGVVSREGPGVTITQGGVALRLTPEPGTRLRVIQELEYRDHSHQPAFARRIVFEPEARACRAEIGFSAEAL